MTTNSTGTITQASRSYGQSGAPTVVRTTSNGATTGHKLNVLITDQLGTANTSVELSSSQPVTRRAFKPYGELRGPKPTAWPNKRSYLGVGIDDAATGLTHMGAREYDQSSGRFLSADPVIDIADPLQMNGYAYSNNGPISHSDPTGLYCDSCNWDTPNGNSNGKTKPDGVPVSNTSGSDENSGKEGLERELRSLVTDVNDEAQLLGMWQHWAFSGADFWNTPAPKSDGSTGIACFGVTGCIKAWQFLSKNPGKVAEAKVIAATYCVRNDCGIDAGQFEALSQRVAELPLMIGTMGMGGGIRALAASIGCKCFLAGTDVLMADGSSKDIEDVDLGDEVLATDPETGETAPKKVTRLIRTEGDKYFNELSIATEDGIEKLTATHEHPFWSPSQKDWVPAGQLEPGMTLRTDEGRTVIVTGNRSFTKQARTYNPTVDGLHTYYVLAGETPVLVHNSGPCGPAKGAVGEARAVQELQDRGYTIMGTHVKLEAKDGTISYVDVVATRNGPGLGAPEYFEVKNGPSARLSPQQKTVYGQLGDSGDVILRSDQLSSWGLNSGDLLPQADVNMILYGGAKAW